MFDLNGKLHGRGEAEFALQHPEPDFVEQSSDDIWRAVGTAVRSAVDAVDASEVAGIGFDATCSLVAIDADLKPVTVSAPWQRKQYFASSGRTSRSNGSAAWLVVVSKEKLSRDSTGSR